MVAVDPETKALISSAVAMTTTAPITLYQSHEISVNLAVARMAASPIGIPLKAAVPPTRGNPSANTKHPSNVP